MIFMPEKEDTKKIETNEGADFYVPGKKNAKLHEKIETNEGEDFYMPGKENTKLNKRMEIDESRKFYMPPKKNKRMETNEGSDSLDWRNANLVGTNGRAKQWRAPDFRISNKTKSPGHEKFHRRQRKSGQK